MALMSDELRTIVIHRICSYVDGEIVTETSEGYEYLSSIGMNVRKVENIPGVLSIGDIRCFSYESIEELDDKVTFSNIEVFKNDFDLTPGKYPCAYYYTKTRKGGVDTIFIDDQELEYEFDYNEVLRRGTVRDIKRMISRIMAMNESTYTVKNALARGNTLLADVMRNTYGMSK
jgi:hypothetical protein